MSTKWGKVHTYEQKGMHNEAISHLQNAVTLTGGGTEAIAGLGHAYAVSSKRAEALRSLVELKAISNRRYVPAYDIAVIYAGLDLKDEAFSWLEKAYHERSPYITYVKVDPRLDRLRDDPRFQDLLRRMNFPEDQTR